MMTMMMDAFKHISERIGGGGVAWGGGDDDTPNNITRRGRAVLLGIYSTFVMSDHLILVTKPTSGLCELDLGISEGFLRKLEFGWGKLVSGMVTTLLRGHPEQHLHTLARTPHATSNANPPIPRSGL